VPRACAKAMFSKNILQTCGEAKRREQVIFLRDQVLPRRQEIVDDTQKQYNAMQVGVFHLLQAKRDQIDAGRQYIERLRDYWVARSGVELIGMGFSDVKNGSSESAGRSSKPGD